MFDLPPLPYKYGALMPVLTETALRTHHAKHHARYVEATNALLAAEGRGSAPLEAVVIEADRAGHRKLFNNAAQSWNHGFFWACMRPPSAGGSAPDGPLLGAIVRTFGGLAGLREPFIAEGAAHFGSGWVWLVAKGGALSVISVHDGATPLALPGVMPLLACDVWEHAYYLDYKNARAAYLSAWWDLLIDWAFVDGQFAAVEAGGPGWRYPAPKAAS